MVREEKGIEGLNQGATAYVLKHRLQRLVPVVRRALRGREERTERQRSRRGVALPGHREHDPPSSLDYHETLASVARLVVPRLADWCVVDVLEEDGTVRRLAGRARGP